MDLQYHFGLRLNEAVTVSYEKIRNALKDNVLRLYKSDGTKGGRPRVITVVTSEQINVLERAVEYAKKHKKRLETGLLTDRKKCAVLRYKNQLLQMYANNAGVLNGMTSHDLRRAYAQNLYNDTEGTDKERMQAVCIALGHGPNRQDITVRYVADRHEK